MRFAVGREKEETAAIIAMGRGIFEVREVGALSEKGKERRPWHSRGNQKGSSNSSLGWGVEKEKHHRS